MSELDFSTNGELKNFLELLNNRGSESYEIAVNKLLNEVKSPAHLNYLLADMLENVGHNGFENGHLSRLAINIAKCASVISSGPNTDHRRSEFNAVAGTAINVAIAFKVQP